MAATTYFFVTPPIRNAAWQFWCFLTSRANPNVFQTTVTLAAGDVTVFSDGVALGNIDTLPVEIGATGCLRVDLSADEMDSAEMTIVKFNDAAGAEWQDAAFMIMPVQAVVVATQDDILTDGTAFPGAFIDTPVSTRSTADEVWDRNYGLLNVGHSVGLRLVNFLDAAISTRTTLGAGAIPFTYELTSTVDGAPIPDADVWAATDTGGNHIVASGRTDAFGRVTFYLGAGTYYFFREKAGWNFSPYDTEVVS